MVRIRMHDVNDFVHAFVDQGFRKKYLDWKGFPRWCYNEGHSRRLNRLFNSVGNPTLIFLVQEKDNLCVACPRKFGCGGDAFPDGELKEGDAYSLGRLVELFYKQRKGVFADGSD